MLDTGPDPQTKSPHILALDLEGTLISNAVSCFPRPGLAAFLDFCRANFRRVVLFTAVSEARVRPILQVLVSEGVAPPWFCDIEIIRWSSPVKDLNFIPNADINAALLVDDLEVYVRPDQRAQWVPIAPFVAPYPESDCELARVTVELRRRLGLAPA